MVNLYLGVGVQGQNQDSMLSHRVRYIHKLLKNLEKILEFYKHLKYKQAKN